MRFRNVPQCIVTSADIGVDVIGLDWGDPTGNRSTKGMSQEEQDKLAEEDYKAMYRRYSMLVRFNPHADA